MGSKAVHLTLDELKTMHGKPVYIKFFDKEKTLPEVFKDGWVVLSVYSGNVFGTNPGYTILLSPEMDYGDKVFAYREEI